jgi:hypothetical protein
VGAERVGKDTDDVDEDGDLELRKREVEMNSERMT